MYSSIFFFCCVKLKCLKFNQNYFLLTGDADILIIHGRDATRLRNAEEQVKEAAIHHKHDLTLHTVLGDLACIQDIRNIAR